MTALEIKDIILSSVDIINGFSTYCVSGGRLNAYKALTELLGHTHYYYYVKIDEYKHSKYCEGCKSYTLENHHWVSNAIASVGDVELQYIPGYTCYYCNATTMLPLN